MIAGPGISDPLWDGPVAVYRATLDGRFLGVNDAMVELMGCPDRETLVSIPITAAHVDLDQFDLFRKALERDGVVIGHEKEFKHYSGRRFWVKDSARLELDDDGEVAGYSGALIDVTVEKRAVDALAESEERFRTLFHRSPVALLVEDFSGLWAWLERLRAAGVTDLRSYLVERPWEVRRGIRLIRVVDVNQAGLDLVGATSRSQLLGPMPDATVAPETESAFIETMVAVWDGRKRLDIDVVGRRMTGERFETVMHWVSLPAAHGGDLSRVVVAMTDVTSIRESQKRLQGLVRSRDDLVAAVSHELRTPLTSVIGFAHELRDHWDDLDPGEAREFARLIGEQGSELAYIVEDLVAAGVEIGSIPVDVAILDLGDQVGEVVRGLPRSVGRRIDITGGSAPALGDPGRVRQILRNLIDNAVRHGGESVEVIVELRDEAAVAIVRDDGAGIPPEHVDRVFERYQRLEPGDVNGSATIGLGLAVSRDLARRMGGELAYRAIQGISTFELFLPIPNA